MTIRVFVSYRRSDSRHATGRLRAVLAREFGRENVFYDVDSVGFGADFRDVINVTLQGVDVLIVIIGPNFELDRLAQPNDYVHMEILEALRLGKAIVPVLVDDAVMPAPGHLPPELESFAYRNAAPLRADPDFDTDAARLVRDLRKSLHPETSDDAIAAQLAPPTGPRVSDPTQGAVRTGSSSVPLADSGSAAGPVGPPIIIQAAAAPRQRTAAIAIGIALLALIGAVVAVTLLRSQPQGGDQKAGSEVPPTQESTTTSVAPTTTAVATTVASTVPTTPAATIPPTVAPPTPSPAPIIPITPAAPSSVSPGQAADLILEYFRTAGTHVDYPAAWDFLSGRYQESYRFNGAVGYDAFVGFWSTVDNVGPSSLDTTEIRHDIDEVTISAPVFFNLYSGVHSEETITVTIIRDNDGRLLLDRYSASRTNA